MTSTASAKTRETPAARQKRVWDRAAPGYDRQIAFFEKTWFAGGREWLGERARGRVLEVAIGTGRNLPGYPAGVTITGIELSPAMLAAARQRAAGSTWPPFYAIQWLAERITIRAAGEHLTRRQLPLVKVAGFQVVETERLKAGTVERVHARRA